MEQVKKEKIKPCIVKLRRYNTMEDPEKIRDRILDKRTRKCHVLLRRVDISKFMDSSIVNKQVRQCCIRLPRLDMEVLDSLEPSSASECDVKSEV